MMQMERPGEGGPQDPRPAALLRPLADPPCWGPPLAPRCRSPTPPTWAPSFTPVAPPAPAWPSQTPPTTRGSAAATPSRFAPASTLCTARLAGSPVSLSTAPASSGSSSPASSERTRHAEHRSADRWRRPEGRPGSICTFAFCATAFATAPKCHPLPAIWDLCELGFGAAMERSLGAGLNHATAAASCAASCLAMRAGRLRPLGIGARRSEHVA